MPLPLLCCLIGLVFTIVMAIIGALLSRSINQMDKRLETACTAVELMKLELVGYSKLTEFMKERLTAAENKCDVLTRSHGEIDTWIKIQQALHKLSPPTQPN